MERTPARSASPSQTHPASRTRRSSLKLGRDGLWADEPSAWVLFKQLSYKEWHLQMRFEFSI